MASYLKNWAKTVGIIGAPNGYLSSYALIMMIIAFLQSKQPPVLPCL
jgi:DNA polymerase sigma